MKKINKILNGLATPFLSLTILPTIISLSNCGNGSSIAALSEKMVEEFKLLTQIPRSSDKILKDVPYSAGNCWNVSCYLRNRLEKIIEHQVVQDKYGNLVAVVEPNDISFESYPTLALQAHMDMVFSYDKDKFDYEPDPKTTKIDLVDEKINGKRTLHSRDYRTSIGADNGMGIAQILAILQDNSIKHGKLRIIFTNCEENALQGAGLLAQETIPNVLNGVKYVLNIDGENLGEVQVASSGSVGSYYNVTYPSATQDSNLTNILELQVSGLPGGHSGDTIHERHVNALKFATDVINELNGTNANVVQLSSISTPGTTVYNAIPTACTVVFATSKTVPDLQIAVKTITNNYLAETVSEDHRSDKHKYNSNEINNLLKTSCEISKATNLPFISVGHSTKILKLQKDLQFGISKWPSEDDLAKLVGDQTSANIGPASFLWSADKTSVKYTLASYSRSNVNSDIDLFKLSNTTATSTLDDDTASLAIKAQYTNDSYCYGWPIDSNDSLRKLCFKGWNNAGVPTEKLSMARTHGALECSWWHYAMAKVSMADTAIVSYGPTIRDAHKITESVEVDSIEACLKTTIYMLQHANELK